MRTHQEIIKQHGVARLYRELVGEGLTLSRTSPQRWAERNSIPGEYWSILVALKVCDLQELASAADRRRRAAVSEAA